VTFLDTCPPCLAEPGDRTGLPMRYVPYNGSATAPAWIHRPRTRKRVCLSMGSILPRHGRGDFRGMLQEWSAALTAIGVEVVVAVADDLAGRWDPRPAGVVAAGWMPMGLVLPACDALLHHGGPGATLTAVLNGVPQVIVPQIVDQFTCARQMLNAGAGLRLLREELSTAAAVEACERVLSDPSFAENARAVARSNATRPTPAETVPVLEAIAESGRLDPRTLDLHGLDFAHGPNPQGADDGFELAHSGAATLPLRRSAASQAGLDHRGPASSPASSASANPANPVSPASPAQSDPVRPERG
jgi:UDP:flavonoid glycosyltransferase YjiC (YdhE family)